MDGFLDEFRDTSFDFGLGMRFYDRFLQIRRPENLPDRPNIFSGFWVRGGGTMGGGATRIGGLMDTKTCFLHGLEAPEAWKPCK